MASTTSLFTGLSGLDVHARRLDVISNNIANVNTTAYKSGAMLFENLFSRTFSAGSAPTGTSGGTKPAPTIIDELATDPAMTRQRGLALLGNTGKQAQISLRLPVLPETGLIRPGKLIEYQEQGNTRRGLVRSLSVNHSRPQLWQTIGVETHE